MRMSSTKSKCVMFMFVAILNPSNSPLLLASRMALLRPFESSKKSRGERGHPCLNPCLAWKKWDAAPLMRTAKEAVVIQAKIHFIKE